MGFSCTIKQKGINIADDVISYALFGLGPSNSEHSSNAQYYLEDFRAVVSECTYGNKLPEAAQDAFRELQYLAQCNKDYLNVRHCLCCSCPATIPLGWSVESINRLLSIDAKEITYLYGGY